MIIYTISSTYRRPKIVSYYLEKVTSKSPWHRHVFLAKVL